MCCPINNGTLENVVWLGMYEICIDLRISTAETIKVHKLTEIETLIKFENEDIFHIIYQIKVLLWIGHAPLLKGGHLKLQSQSLSMMEKFK